MKDSTFKKYKLVIDEWFVNGFNGTKAYQQVYPDSTEDTADKGFREIHGIPRIETYVKERHKNAQVTLDTTHTRILEELRNWAYSDITETMMLPPEDVKALPKEIRRLITKFKTVTKSYTIDNVRHSETIVELHFVSKEKAMEMIQKHTGFYEADNKQKNPEQKPPSITFHGRGD